MIWVISKSLNLSKYELVKYHEYIEQISLQKTSPWNFYPCEFNDSSDGFYKCFYSGGEYGVVITAHINEVPYILNKVVSRKIKALIAINSCCLSKDWVCKCCKIIKEKNSQSEVYFAKQLTTDLGILVNPVDNVGTFGFSTTYSERLLFKNREHGLETAIRKSFDKISVFG